ncbi:Uu.00g004690.m01.CDS01 [Anthostomella pinea]|uniref:Autophagy-related protein 101 n=1 Tax=Anthostomella pinea TaxID=933095 RepID=A0AAI8VJX3_9PEZI|nr:Uu.00g004690.m01.CDS01 [Anthostomella pinea]
MIPPSMEQQRPQEFILEAFTDPASVRDVVRGKQTPSPSPPAVQLSVDPIFTCPAAPASFDMHTSLMLYAGILHTIFFHRFFPSLTPRHREVLDIMLPYVEDAELDTMIEKRAAELARELDAERTHTQQTNPDRGGRSAAQQAHQRASSVGGGSSASGGGGGGGGGRGNISVQFFEKKRRKAWYMRAAYGGDDEVCWEMWTVRVTVAEPRTESERAKVRQAMQQTLTTTVMKIVTSVNSHKDHIPPITTSEANPFPYQIIVNQKGEPGWASRMGIY